MIKVNAKIKPTLKPNIIHVEVPFWQLEQLRKLDDKKNYVVEIKQFKDKRSLEQNSMLWGLIHQINLAFNGFKADKKSEMELYCQLVENAQIKRDFIATLPDAKPSLETVYRVVKEANKTIKTDKQVELSTYICYRGSSHFDTEEMSRFIDSVLDLAEQVGIDTREYI